MSGSSWSAGDSRLVLKYANVLGSLCCTHVPHDQPVVPCLGRDWFQLSHLELARPSARPTVFNASQVTAPSNYAWRCAHLSSLQAFGAGLQPQSPSPGWGVLLQDVQLQGFNVTGLRFSYASDCAGFFARAPGWGFSRPCCLAPSLRLRPAHAAGPQDHGPL
ncbi:unnamed protein product [Eretmochelys imbricata]